MENYELTVQDHLLLDEMIKYAKILEKHVNILYQLELEGKKNSEEYQKELRNIEMILEYESIKYDEAKLDGRKALGYIKYIIEKNQFKYLAFEPREILFVYESDRVFKRVCTILENFISSDYYFLAESVDPELTNIIEMKGIAPTKGFIANGLKNGHEIRTSIFNEIINNFLNLIEECIEETQSDTLKKELIKMKYNVFLYNKEFETKLLKNSFNANKINYNSIVEPDDELYPDENAKKFIVDKLCSDLANKEIMKVLFINSSACKDKDRVIKTFLGTILLRSYFVLMSDETIETLNEEFHKFIDSFVYAITNIDKNNGETEIKKAFLKVRRDKRNHDKNNKK